MSLRSQHGEILTYIKDNSSYIDNNFKLFDIYNGNLKPYIQEELEESLSKNYFNQIKDLTLPINILKRIIDKLAKIYSTKPSRNNQSGLRSDDDLLEFYEQQFKMEVNGNSADEFSHLFKGFAWEPYLKNGLPKLRTIPFNQFLVASDDIIDPTEPTMFIKFMGQVKGRSGLEDLFYVYNDDEFLPLLGDGTIYLPALEGNDGVNLFGFIPFVYGSRSRHSLLPVQETDVLPLCLNLPKILSFGAGGLMFQTFSVFYGVDVDIENLSMTPNAFWNIKSDPSSDKKPEIGVIKPQMSIDDIINFVKTNLSLWLESKGIKAGSMGHLNSDNFASGISKIIDEMDTSEQRKVSVLAFTDDEKELWSLTKRMHNKWVEQGKIKGSPAFSEGFDVSIIFDEQKPIIDRKTQVETIKLEVDSGFLDKKTAIEMLYPDLDDNEIEERIKLVEEKENILVSKNDPQGEKQKRIKIVEEKDSILIKEGIQKSETPALEK